MKKKKYSFVATGEEINMIEKAASNNNQKVSTFLRSVVVRQVQTDILLASRAEEYVQLVEEIESIDDVEKRIRLRKRLEAFVCL